jgi:hypothetical protein
MYKLGWIELEHFIEFPVSTAEIQRILENSHD